MIAHVNGKMVEKNPAYAIIECGGVGYYLNISLHTYSRLGNDENCKLFTHLVVREDAHILYGFSETNERQLFRHLISVSGVGPNTALLVLSSLQPAETQRAIVEGDVRALQSVKGIGAKSAQRIILDLKDKLPQDGLDLENISAPVNNTVRDEALSALVALGFDKSTSGKLIKNIMVSGEDMSVEEIIKTALKKL
ncbi:MAG: Holliday junction branch migration protein RuvA [Salibacteraceae bacterium]